MKEIARLGMVLLVISSANASEPKDASDVTKEVNNQVKQELPFNDKRDFKDAQRGFVAKQEVVTITNENGDIVCIWRPIKITLV